MTSEVSTSHTPAPSPYGVFNYDVWALIAEAAIEDKDGVRYVPNIYAPLMAVNKSLTHLVVRQLSISPLSICSTGWDFKRHVDSLRRQQRTDLVQRLTNLDLSLTSPDDTKAALLTLKQLNLQNLRVLKLCFKSMIHERIIEVPAKVTGGPKAGTTLELPKSLRKTWRHTRIFQDALDRWEKRDAVLNSLKAEKCSITGLKYHDKQAMYMAKIQLNWGQSNEAVEEVQD